MEDLFRILSDHPFLKGLDSHHVQFLTTCTSNVVFKPGEYLLREGGFAAKIYLLREGEVNVQAYNPGRGVITLSTLHAGDVAGWSWATPPYTTHFDVVALTPIRAICVDAECLRQKCHSDPEFGYEMLSRMTKAMEERLRTTRLQLLDFYGADR
jgi:CRP-like cAMP-binding protein